MKQPASATAPLDIGSANRPKPSARGARHKTISVTRLCIQQIVVNFVVIAALIVAGAFLVFNVMGESYTQFTVAGFIAVTYFSFIVFIPAGTLFACRAELAKGTVAIDEKEKTGATEPLADPLLKTLPLGIALAIVSTGLVWALIYGAGWMPSPVTTVLLSLLFVIPYAIIVRREIFADIEGLAATGPMHGKRLASRTRHFWMSYVLPNLVLQAIINMPLADRGLSNAAAAIADRVGPGMVPVAALVPDFAITFMFVCNFTFLGVVAHTVSDLYQGKLAYSGTARGINGFLYFFLMLLMGVALGAVVAVAAQITGTALLSFPMALILKFLVVLLSVYVGCRLSFGWTGKKFNDAAASSIAARVRLG